MIAFMFVHLLDSAVTFAKNKNKYKNLWYFHEKDMYTYNIYDLINRFI